MLSGQQSVKTLACFGFEMNDLGQ